MIRFHSSLVLTMTAALLAGCAAKRGAKTAPTTAAPVHIVIAESKERVATEEEAGTVQAKLHAVIAAQISGRVETMLVSPGQPVTAGELLVTISAREVQAQYEQALAQRQLAASNLRRATNLLNERVLSQAEFDQAQARFRVADAAAMEARTLADYAQVRAPFTGIITRKDADQGDLATPGKALLEMEDPTALRLEANVPEDLAGNVKVGDTLNVRIGALQTNFMGMVAEVAPSADPNSRTFVVKLDLPRAPGLMSGQFGEVAVPDGTVKALRVPASALIRRGQMELLVVVRAGRAELRIVKSGAQTGNEVEIVSGLDPGEAVVAANGDDLTDGEAVTVENGK